MILLVFVEANLKELVFKKRTETCFNTQLHSPIKINPSDQ